MVHSYFGSLDFALPHPWSREVTVSEHRVRLGLTSNGATAEQLDDAAVFAREIGRFAEIARAALAADHAAGGDVTTMYLDHHREELSIDVRLDQLVLARLGLHPDDPSRIAVFDFTLDGNVTNYVLAVTFDHTGHVVDVAMES